MIEENKLNILELTDQDYQEIQKKLGIKIKIARLKKKVSVSQLCEISDISAKHISNIENGKVGAPSLKVYLKICYALNMNPTDLFSDIENEPPFNDEDYNFIDWNKILQLKSEIWLLVFLYQITYNFDCKVFFWELYQLSFQ